MSDYVRCPKCGQDDPAVGWKGPEYQCLSWHTIQPTNFPVIREWLSYVCKKCGYERREHTKDAKPDREIHEAEEVIRQHWLSRFTSPWRRA